MSLISLMSCVVIALVVWLVLVFLSVTEGIEKGWLSRLTTLNAPIRITPTQHYLNSYYHLVDGIAYQSGYTLKSVGEKWHSEVTDPYDPEIDSTPPPYFPTPLTGGNGQLKDLVKCAAEGIHQVQQSFPISAQDFETTGALIRLKMHRPELGLPIDESQSYLTQVTHITSLSDTNRKVSDLFTEIEPYEINHLFHLANLDIQDTLRDEADQWSLVNPETFQKTLKPLIEHTTITEVKPYGEKPLSVTLDTKSFKTAQTLSDILFRAGDRVLPWIDLEITKASAKREFETLPKSLPPWAILVNGQIVLPTDNSVILPKSYQDAGVEVGDTGYLSFGAFTPSSVKEQRVAVDVAGFYDPGAMSIGAKSALAPPQLVRNIALSNHSFSFSPTNSQGFHVYFDDLSQTKGIAAALKERFEALGIAPFFAITPFTEYGFAKDLMQQFQSDRTLFTLVGGIILVVACTNIISLLVLLVNDKRREIAILQAMGASRKSIGAIFALSGVIMGIMGSLVGVLLALLTLHNIDAVAHLLSAIQGHEAFNSAFYGTSLPNRLAPSAVWFILISTPLLSLVAGLVPAVKACRLRPTEALKS